MNYSIYETININDKSSINAFVMSLDSVKWHWHKEYEFIGILSGQMSLRIQSDEVVLKTGDIALLNPREIHALNKISSECLCMIVQVTGEFFSFCEEDDEIIHFYLNSACDEEPICGYELLYYRIAKIVYESLVDSRVSEFRIRAQVCSIIADLMEFSVYDKRKNNKDARNQQDMLSALIVYFESNLMSENLLDESCVKFGISRKTLDRITDSILDISAKELIDSLRLENAKKLLKYSGKTIGYIMDICGYKSENTFYRSFKKYTGLTPKDFRDSVKREDDRDELKGYLDYETPRVIALLKEIVERWEQRNYNR